MVSSTVKLIDPPLVGRIEKLISPTRRGRVSALGSYWYAECYGLDCKRVLEAGQDVLVVCQRGNTLLVIPMDSEDSHSSEM